MICYPEVTSLRIHNHSFALLIYNLKNTTMIKTVMAICLISVSTLALSQKQNMIEKKTSLQEVLDKSIDDKKIFGTSFALKKDTLTWIGASGDIAIDQQYFIASTTKLFTTAIILNLKSKDVLSLDDEIAKYLDDSIVSGIHIYKGIDYSANLTIRHLLSHTSGLPDYFQNKGANGKSLEDELLSGNDQTWTFDQAIGKTKSMNPLFIPGTKNKAHYSDANFQLLGKIIENITGKSYSENCEILIINPLNLEHTYLYKDPADKSPKTMYYKAEFLDIPKAMSSFGADGGIVSTSSEMLLFIEAFFTGKFFPSSYIEELQKWNKLFFTMQSGIGIQKFKLPWVFSSFGTIPFFIGHSGQSGALAFYSPKENLFIVGTVNQVGHPELAFKTMIKLTQKVLRK